MNNKQKKRTKWNHENVKLFIEETSNSGCKLLDDYRSLYEKIRIKCSCGEVFVRTFASFNYNKHRVCRNCSGVTDWNYKSVRDFIEAESKSGCKLVSTEYFSAKDYINIRCECGNVFKTAFNEFLHNSKRQCNDCGIALRTGKNSPLWKGGITNARVQTMRTPEYKYWKKEVFERDGYQCQCCGDKSGGNLSAHHIVNFSSNTLLRYDISNGVTLCELCHSPSKYGSFHHTYGTKYNDGEELEEYIEWYKSDVENIGLK